MKTSLLIFLLCPLLTGAQTYQQKVVAAVLMGEAWNQGKVGMEAVGEVIYRRSVLSGRTPLAVVCRPKAFSCLNGRKPEALIRKFAGQPDFQVALGIAKVITDAPHRLPGITQGATHFTRVDERPSWARGTRPLLVLNDHAFYRLPYR